MKSPDGVEVDSGTVISIKYLKSAGMRNNGKEPPFQPYTGVRVNERINLFQSDQSMIGMPSFTFSQPTEL